MFPPADYENLKYQAYKAYQLHWMISHGHSLMEAIDLIQEYAKYCTDFSDPNEIITNEDGITRLFDQANDIFLFEQGFGSGSMFACEGEFLDHEFLDRDYMKMLLGLMPNAKYLSIIYDDYMKEVA